MIEIAQNFQKFPFIELIYTILISLFILEMTFTHKWIRKFEPREWNLIFGNWIKLPLKVTNNKITNHSEFK